ncbi:MAG: hypothetical protein VCA34_17145, partial [Roseibacillus sp.]
MRSWCGLVRAGVSRNWMLHYSVAYIEQISEGEARGTLQEVYHGARTRAGGVANIIKLMSRDAPVLQGSMMLYASLMKSDNALS